MHIWLPTNNRMMKEWKNEFRKIRLETLNNRTSDRENKREIFIEGKNIGNKEI